MPAGSCYIEAVGVAEWGRGRGVGKAFMQFADNDARAHGCNVSVCLHLSFHNFPMRIYAVKVVLLDGVCISTA